MYGEYLLGVDALCKYLLGVKLWMHCKTKTTSEVKWLNSVARLYYVYAHMVWVGLKHLQIQNMFICMHCIVARY